jgi:hypothetical protein
MKLPEYKNGGVVKKTGLAKVHKGELVIPTKQVKKVQSLLKKAGLPCGCGCKGVTRK